MAVVEVASVDFRQAMAAVRAMLERAGTARAVEVAELRARRFDIMAIAARAGRFGAALSPDMEALLLRLARELEPADAPAAEARALAS